MSTRAVIARETGDGTWEGREHHFDGYPEGLGRTLYRLYHGPFERDVGRMARFLIDEHPGGWSTIQDVDWSKPAGYGGEGPRCYCHGERSEEGFLFTESNVAESDKQWVYVLLRDRPAMAVLRVRSGGARQLTVVELNGPEPDWGQIEAQGERV